MHVWVQVWADTPECLPVHGRTQSSQLAVGVFTHSEWNFQVLSTPDIHACVICANLLEIISVYGEQAACHRGSPGDRQDRAGGKLRVRCARVTCWQLASSKVTQHLQMAFQCSGTLLFMIFLFLYFVFFFCSLFCCQCLTASHLSPISRPFTLTEGFPAWRIELALFPACLCFL